MVRYINKQVKSHICKYPKICLKKLKNEAPKIEEVLVQIEWSQLVLEDYR